MQKILIVEDDFDIADNISRYLTSRDAGLTVVVEHDGFSAFSRAATDDTVAMCVLDIGLPGMDGISLCRRLRTVGWTNPVIMLTALDTVEDKVRGLEAGADDYLVKLFSLEELYARIRAQLRRNEIIAPKGVLRVGDLVVNPQTFTAERAGVPLKLGNITLQILILLMKKSPAVVTRDELISEVWHGPVSNETVRSHMYLLRNVVDKPFHSAMITTLPKIGWALAEISNAEAQK